MTHRVDLHIHTRVSDGQHSAAEIVRMALKAGLQTIAITDHDAVEAVPEAIEAVQGSGLTVLSGVEISADAGSLEIHILGYLVDWEDAELARGLAASRTSRVERAGEMLARLRGLGVLLSAERVAELADGGSIGRPHIALALREAGYVSTVQEAFDRYLGQGRPAYVPRSKMTPREAIERVLAAGGVPVLAHPFGITALVPELVTHGLAGLEAYYTGYSTDATAEVVHWARQYGLVCTGGSDFHGLDILPDNALGGVWVPPSAVRKLFERRRELATAARGL